MSILLLVTINPRIMADSKTKSTESTSDGWGPWGAPSTWRLKFREQEYNESVSRRAQELKANPNMPQPRSRTATEILEDAHKERLEMWARADKPYIPPKNS